MNEPPNFLSWKDTEPPANKNKGKSSLKNHLGPLPKKILTFPDLDLERGKIY